MGGGFAARPKAVRLSWPINNACGRQALILENRRENNFPFDLYSDIRYELLLIAKLAAVRKSSHKILHISYSHLLFVTL